MGFLLALLGGVAETLAKKGGGSGGGPAAVASYLAQKGHWADDDNRYAPRIERNYMARPYEKRPGIR